MTKLEKVIEKMIGLGAVDRIDALCEISRSCDINGMWNTANTFCVLDENRSCEDFAIEFMTAYNNEVNYKY